MLSKWVQNVPKKSNYVNTFLGVNFTENYQEGEIKSGYGLSTEKYPCLYQRRGRAKQGGTYISAYGWDNHFVYIDYSRRLTLDETVLTMLVGDHQRQFAVVNNKLVIYPDKLIVDISDHSLVRMDSSFSMTSTVYPDGIEGPAKRTKDNTEVLNVECGTEIGFVFLSDDPNEAEAAWDGSKWNITPSSVLPLDLKEGDAFALYKTPLNEYAPMFDAWYYWRYGLNTDGKFAVVKTVTKTTNDEGVDRAYITYDVYTVSSGSYVAGSEKIKAGDMLSVTVGSATYDNCMVKSAYGNSIKFTDNCLANAYPKTNTSVTVKRVVPDLDYICSINNRLWGVSNSQKTIYSSALGFPDQFFDYSSDTAGSYAVAVGSEGDFTGIVAYADNVYCFKENCCHKMMGSYPSEYYMTEYKIPGIQKGSNKSAIVLNNVLYYKGVNSFYSFTGSTPTPISYKLGDVSMMKNAVAGTDQKNYMVSVNNGSSGGNEKTYVLDITHGIWTVYDNIYFTDYTVNSLFSQGSQAPYPLVAISNHELYLITRGSTLPTWEAEFTPFYAASTYNGKPSVLMNRKGLTRLIIRMDLEENSNVKVELKLDNGAYTTIKEQSAAVNKTLLIPVRIGRCDKYSIRLSGTGYCTVRSIYREYSFGSMR